MRRFFRQTSTPVHPELQLEQAAADVTSGQRDEFSPIVQLQVHALSQAHQLQVAADVRLGRDQQQGRGGVDKHPAQWQSEVAPRLRSMAS